MTGVAMGSVVKRTELLNLPNTITWLRVVAALPIMLLLVDGSQSLLWIAFVLMVFAEVTDGLDGYVARRSGQVSAVGKILDPMADSLYRMAVFTAFAANGWLPIWMFIVLMYRDIGVSYIRIIMQQSAETMGARSSGKWKAVVQGAAQLIVVAIYAYWGAAFSSNAELVAGAALFIATIVTGYSLVDYTLSATRALTRSGESA